jgi:hypothetical protein
MDSDKWHLVILLASLTRLGRLFRNVPSSIQTCTQWATRTRYSLGCYKYIFGEVASMSVKQPVLSVRREIADSTLSLGQLTRGGV